MRIALIPSFFTPTSIEAFRILNSPTLLDFTISSQTAFRLTYRDDFTGFKKRTNPRDCPTRTVDENKKYYFDYRDVTIGISKYHFAVKEQAIPYPDALGE